MNKQTCGIAMIASFALGIGAKLLDSVVPASWNPVLFVWKHANAYGSTSAITETTFDAFSQLGLLAIICAGLCLIFVVTRVKRNRLK